MSVQVIPPDPAWRSEFEAEAQRIAQALGEIVVRIHHIGSTAIPDIWAKPIIDLLLEVNQVAELDERSSALEMLGYVARGEFGISGRRYFRKDNAHGTRTHHLHAYGAGSAEIERHLAFRDYMIAHPREAQLYCGLKQKLAHEHPDDMESYVAGKNSFIKEHEAKALAWSLARSVE